MFRVLSCLTAEHDLRLVGLAGMVCFLASLAAINLFHRAAATRGRARAVWLGTAGAASGCGIWATHFIAMLAYDPGIGVNYNVGLTVCRWCWRQALTAAGLVRRRLQSKPLGDLGRRRIGRRRRRVHALSGHVGARNARPYRVVRRSRRGFGASWHAVRRGKPVGCDPSERHVGHVRPQACCSPWRSFHTISPPWARSRSCRIRAAPSMRCRSPRPGWRSGSRMRRSPFSG